MDSVPEWRAPAEEKCSKPVVPRAADPSPETALPRSFFGKAKMDKLTTLKKTDDFDRIYREGRSCGNRLFVLYAAEPEPGRSGRLGISVSKKVGNSVVRHRIRRLIKECFRLHISEWADRDYIVAARKEAVGKSYSEIEASLLHLGKKTSAYLQQGENE